MNIRTDTFVGLDYFAKVIRDTNFLKAIKNTVLLWGGSYIFELSSAMIIAAIFTYINVKGEHFFKCCFFLPNIISTTAVATLFSMFGSYPSGIINQFCLSIGIVDEPIKFMTDPSFLRAIIIFIGWWIWYGRTSILVGTGMTSIGNDIYEAAKIDGANFWNIFFKITIPLIKPTLVFLLTASVIGGLQIFDIPYMMAADGGTGNVATTAVTYIYKQAFTAGNFGYASALTTYLFGIIVLCSIILNFFLKREK